MILRWRIFSFLALLALCADECRAASCKSGWTERNGYCYMASAGELMWQEAESFCLKEGGHLTSIADIVERNWIFNTFISGTGKNFWIGLNDLAKEDVWQWTDKSFADSGVFNWKIGEPNNGDDGEDCVVIKDEQNSIGPVPQGNWVDIECRKERNYICKMEPVVIEDCDASQGFVKYGSYCYYYSEEEKTWQDAEDYCKNDKNAELTAVTSSDEQAYIDGVWNTYNKDIWIGLSDTDSPGMFHWSNGHDPYIQDSSYDNWGPDEPATASGSSCVKSTVVLDGQWSTQKCSDYYSFVCRKGLRAVCPTNWIYGHGKCYELVMNSKFFLTWTEANSYCKAKNARLLEIQTDDEAFFISSFASVLIKDGILQLWLGISDIGHDEQLLWADQKPITYSQWDVDPPVTRVNQYDCAQVYTGKASNNWEVTSNCFSQQAFMCEVHEGTPISDVEIPEIEYSCTPGWRLLSPYCYYFGMDEMSWWDAEAFCQLPEQGSGHLASIHDAREESFIAVHTNPKPPPTLPPDANELLCGNGYIHHPNTHKCYKFVNEVFRTWVDAREHCRAEGGDLASINSPDEQSFISIRIATIPNQWGMWIGGIDEYRGVVSDAIPDRADGGWKWSDDSPFNYVAWNAGEPNNVNNEDCIEMGVSHGLWNDLKCSDVRGYICEREDPDHATEAPEPDCNGVNCCYRHIGVEVGGWVEDDQLTSSSQLDPQSGANRGRLNTPDQYVDILGCCYGRGAWVADRAEKNPWIQVDLKDFYEIRGVVTQGRNGISQPVNQNYWVRKITVSYKTHKTRNTWEPVRDANGNTVTFAANHDQNTQVSNVFPRPVIATGIRITCTDCRQGCGLRFELLGCNAVCVQSLGVGADGQGNFPLLPTTAFTASSSQAGFEPAFARLDYSESNALNAKHYKLDSSTMTWTSAREYCYSQGTDLCSYDDICSTGTPIITGVQSGDNWAPIRDSYNDWVEIGDDNSPQNPGRVCWKHNENYGAPDWGITTGNCDPWTTETDPCPHKGHVYCCPGNTQCWKPASSDKNQWLQVDLGEYRKVAGILLQGNPQSPEWVTEYYVQFSDDGTSFTTYQSADNKNQLFPGSENQNMVNEGLFREPINTRFIRILPQSWSSGIAIRFDAIGCNPEALASCTDTAEAFTDDSFYVDCPARCSTTSVQVWGTGVYTTDSYICAAAIHDGRIKADHGGAVEVKKVKGLSSYTGSTQNGVTSKNYGAWPGSFMFQGDHLGCPAGWDGWQDWCYYTPRMSVKLSWGDARQYCQSFNADLVSIHNQGEHDFVTSMFFYQYAIDTTWIGLNDLTTQNYYQWSDSSQVTWTRWDTNEPNGGDERCVEMYKISGLWNDNNCEDQYNVICKMDKIPVNQDQEAVDGCEAGWVAFEGSCYFIDLTRMVWINSENYCKGVGGHLAAVNGLPEQMWLLSQVAQAIHSSDDEHFWIGLGAFLDPANSEALIYQWSTGEPVSYTNWAANQPSIQHTCHFPFLYEGIEYYTCIEEGWPYRVLGPWCSADPVFYRHPVACNGWTDGQVGCFRMDSKTGYWSQGQPFACGSDAYKICEKPRVGYTNPAPPTTPSANGNCPYGWYSSAKSNFCYQINNMEKTKKLGWNDANIHCTSQGADLVSMHSTQEEQLVLSGALAAGGGGWYWIGMRRMETGSYSWSDGSSVSYTNWGSGEPNSYQGREECAMAYYGDGSPGTDIYWNDMNCEAAENWVCKILRGTDLLPAVTPSPGITAPSICGYDVDWYAYAPPGGQQYCYHFGNTPVKGFYAAGQFCRGLGGELASIHSRDEQAFITGRASKVDVNTMWIGLLQESVGGYYVWADKTMLDYSFWEGGQPNDNNGQESCVEIRSSYGVWRDANCGLANGYICKKAVGAQPGTIGPTPTMPGGCPENWLMYGSKCFLEVGFTDSSLRKNWTEAEKYCEAQGGFLASVPNQYYSAFLTSQLFATSSSIWIGLNTLSNNNRVFLWSDNEAVTFTNWAPDEPNNQGPEDCVEMYGSGSSTGRWNDKSCDVVKPFFCNMWRDPMYQPPSPDQTGCPNGYTNWDTGCYKLFSKDNEQLSWPDARDKCRSEGKRLNMQIELTSIWNVYENSALKSLFWPEADYDYSWIGLYYNHTANGQTTFKWSDGSPLYYTNWETNQPQQVETALGCAEMREYGTWSVVAPSGGLLGDEDSCDTKRPFVCKHEKLIIPTGDPGLGTCDLDWVSLGDYCYLVKPGYATADLRSWGDADMECQNRVGYLASIHSDIENKAFVSWTDHKNVWFGLKRNGWGGWEWIDKTPVDFTNWAPNEPNDVGDTGEQCAEMYQSGEWNDISCYYTRGYICKKHKMYATCSFTAADRTDCGPDGVNEFECLERGCCWDAANTEASFPCFYSRDDAQCLEKGGTCKNYEAVTCELGYEQSLCSGGNENRCCFVCDENDQTCQDQVDSWEMNDDPCHALSGECKFVTNYCSGSFLIGYCGGPGDRQCCTSHGPSTQKPPMTEPHGTNTPSTGTPGTGTPGTGTTKSTTKGNPTGIPVDTGLSGGAIAGIVISVIIIVVGLAVAIFFYQRGDMPAMPSMPSFSGFGGSKKMSSDMPSSFDNPIVFVNDSGQDSLTVGDDNVTTA